LLSGGNRRRVLQASVEARQKYTWVNNQFLCFPF
jgi:hypothetical protein